jgi:hypothetical protein
MASWEYWNFENYGPKGPENPITSWRETKLSVQQRSDVSTLLGIMRNQRQWSNRDFRSRLQGYEGLSEIRLKSERSQIRLVGCFRPGFRYVILIGCIHKDSVYDPHHCLKTADRRRREINRGEVKTSAYSVSVNEGP